MHKVSISSTSDVCFLWLSCVFKRLLSTTVFFLPQTLFIKIASYLAFLPTLTTWLYTVLFDILSLFKGYLCSSSTPPTNTTTSYIYFLNYSSRRKACV